MHKDLIELIEGVNAQSATASFMSLMKHYVGDVGVGSYTGKKYEPVESGDMGIKRYGIHFIVKDDPKKAIRILFDAKQQPIAIQVWKDFGFADSEMKKPDATLEVDPENDLEQVFHQAISMLVKGSKQIQEAYSELSPQAKEQWRKLRKEVRTRAPSMTRTELIKQYWAKAQALKVSKHTFKTSWIEHARNSAPKLQQQAAPTPGKPVQMQKQPRNDEHDGYVSSVQRMTKRGEDPEEIVHRIDRYTRTFTGLLKKGHGSSLLITGVPGTGKTYLVTQVLGQENMGKTWELYKGVVSPLSLYAFLYKNRHDKILVFDDTDVFKSEDMLNMFKAALDSKQRRTVSWSSTARTVTKPKNMTDEAFEKEKDEELDELTSKGREDKWKAPNKFDFTSRVIFITNEPMSKILANPHLGAIASRTVAKVDYDFDDKLILTKMGHAWEHMRPDLPKEQRRQVFEIIRDAAKSGKINKVTMRTLDNAYFMLAGQQSVETIKQMAEDGIL